MNGRPNIPGHLATGPAALEYRVPSLEELYAGMDDMADHSAGLTLKGAAASHPSPLYRDLCAGLLAKDEFQRGLDRLDAPLCEACAGTSEGLRDGAACWSCCGEGSAS